MIQQINFEYAVLYTNFSSTISFKMIYLQTNKQKYHWGSDSICHALTFIFDRAPLSKGFKLIVSNKNIIKPTGADN